MKAQGSRIILYSFTASPEGGEVFAQLADIGHANTIKLNRRAHLRELLAESSDFILVLLLTHTVRDRQAVIEVLEMSRNLPVLGLFSGSDATWEPQLIQACDEVTTWPCSNPELEFRLRKLLACPVVGQGMGHNLFVNMQIMGNSPEFLKVLDQVARITRCDVPLLIDGQTGTGKELIARAIHYLGDRKDRPFIAANCGAIPDQLAENEFFGHSKGAYTDAREARDGIISQAEGGTLFLDEIEALSPKGQVTLLRFLDNMQYRPLGSEKTIQANLRIVTATNESISEMVADGSFRKDLYYRINIVNICLPPLKDRAGDVNLLADHFIRKFRVQYGQPEKVLNQETREALKYYDWPGNVRELENMLHRAFLLADGNDITIGELETVNQERRGSCGDRRMRKMFDESMAKAKSHLIENFEQQYLCSALDRADGNISRAARFAGKERRSFTRLLDKYEIGKARNKTH